jgi:hypothetical protein
MSNPHKYVTAFFYNGARQELCAYATLCTYLFFPWVQKVVKITLYFSLMYIGTTKPLKNCPLCSYQGVIVVNTIFGDLDQYSEKMAILLKTNAMK